MVNRSSSRSWALGLLLVAGAPGWLGAVAGEVHDREQARGEMKVCIWPDYQRIAFRDPHSDQLSGLDIDQPGVLVGVQTGTFMEPVLRQYPRHAGLVPIQLPQTRERERIAGRVDVFMTDYPYGRALVENGDWATLLALPVPFHVLPYAHASKPGEAEWRATLNTFARIRQDGRLDTAARRHGLASAVLP